MIERHNPGSTRRLTLGADKGYDTKSFVSSCIVRRSDDIN